MTSPILVEAQAALVEAEERICELIEDATRVRDYANVPVLAGLARRIQGLGTELLAEEGAEEHRASVSSPGDHRSAMPAESSEETPSGRKPAVRRNASAADTRRQVRSLSPSFTRSATELRMVTSGQGGSPQRATAARSTVDAVTSYLEGLTEEPSIEDLIAGASALSPDRIGDGQIRAVADWLIEEGILAESQHGSLLTTESGTDLRAAVEELWERLPVE